MGTLPKRRRKQTLSLVVAASVVEVSALLGDLVVVPWWQGR